MVKRVDDEDDALRAGLGFSGQRDERIKGGVRLLENLGWAATEEIVQAVLERKSAAPVLMPNPSPSILVWVKKLTNLLQGERASVSASQPRRVPKACDAPAMTAMVSRAVVMG